MRHSNPSVMRIEVRPLVVTSKVKICTRLYERTNQDVGAVTLRRDNTRSDFSSGDILRSPDQTKLATQTSIARTPFPPPGTFSKLASHASRNAKTTPRSLSSLIFSSTCLSKEGERQAETSHCPSNNPSPLCTRLSLSNCHPAARASSVRRFGPSTVRMFEILLGLRHSSAACASAAST
jgi:hypothetical protein